MTTNKIELIEKGFTKTAWIPTDDEMSFDEWESLGMTLQQIDHSLPWWIGDWLNYGEYAWGEAYAQAMEITGMGLDRLNNYKWIANKVDPSVRREELSWSHHRAVAPFAAELQKAWLDRAEQNGWSVNELFREIQLENMAILDPPDISENGSHEPEEAEPEELAALVSPTRRLRYALKMLLERHLKLAPYDVDHTIIVQAQNIFQETQHAENEDLDEG